MPRAFLDIDHTIEKLISDMCEELGRTPATHEDFKPLVNAISKLRASMNSCNCERVEK